MMEIECMDCGWEGKFEELAKDGTETPALCPICSSDQIEEFK